VRAVYIVNSMLAFEQRMYKQSLNSVQLISYIYLLIHTMHTMHTMHTIHTIHTMHTIPSNLLDMQLQYL
jgi:hypothetical protein